LEARQKVRQRTDQLLKQQEAKKQEEAITAEAPN
jgi:hypothetical protein